MCCVIVFFFFKQKTAYELRIIDSSSDLCSSDLGGSRVICRRRRLIVVKKATGLFQGLCYKIVFTFPQHRSEQAVTIDLFVNLNDFPRLAKQLLARSEEHTSELQSLMRISYAVFCLKKQKRSLS